MTEYYLAKYRKKVYSPLGGILECDDEYSFSAPNNEKAKEIAEEYRKVIKSGERTLENVKEVTLERIVHRIETTIYSII